MGLWLADLRVFASGAITAAAIAADAIGASELAADAVAEIADAVWDEDATANHTGGNFGQAIGDPGADTNTIFKATVTDATGATVGVDVAAVLADTGTDGVVVASINNNAITAASIAADAITDAKVAADVTIASVTGAVGSVTGNVGGNVTGSVGSIATGGIAAASFAAGAIYAAAIAADAIGSSELAATAVSEIVTGVLTTQMTEAYAADGAAPTLAQALMLIQQQLGDFSIAGTTLTVKKLDGTTTAATFTLNDGTSPTSLTRAT